MRLNFGIGTRTQTIDVPEKDLITILEPKDIEYKGTGINQVIEALKNPIGTDVLSKIVSPGEKVVIITSDITRPFPTYRVIPYILDELYKAGVKSKDISIVFALGIHREHTEQEKRKLVGDNVFEEIRCIDSDISDFIKIGTTKMGTPVEIDRRVIEADRRICLGNIEYHYFAGYSGGGKAIMPGVSTKSAIQVNHSKMILEEAHAGKIDGNPVREDIEEAAKMVGVDFILNVVLDSKKEIIKAFAGDMVLAHREGCSFLDQIYRCYINEKADIVIVSQGGAPKDLNLYQTQKALDNAKHAVKKGGVIILVGSCKEGFGEDTFEEWMLTAKTSNSIIERIYEEFKLGGHKAAAIAMVLQNADIYLVSDMDPELVKSIFMIPFSTVEEAFEAAKNKCGLNSRIISMPYGGSTLPTLDITI